MWRAIAPMLLVALVGCSLATDLDALRGDGGNADVFVAPDGPTSAAGFKISVAPPTVKIGPNGGDILTVDVTRIDGFSGAIAITVNDLPANVTASPLTITGVGGSVNLGSNGAQAGEYDVTVVGTSGSQVSTAPLHLHVGGRYQVLTASGTIKVPKGNTSIIVKLWGGGGGGGHQVNVAPGMGGGGGYTEDTLTVTPEETLDVDVGTGGKPSNGGGAGGGGYSAVKRAGTILVQAGGGGGGGGSCSNATGGAGGAGGGAIAQGGSNGANGCCGGSGGTQTNGKALNQGGNAGNDGAAGLPGGGMGEGNACGGGGGGGGKWGGREGDNGTTFQTVRGGSGGGGGSAMFSALGKAITGNGPASGSPSDPDAQGAGTGGGINAPGTDGRVVVYLP